MGDVPLILVVGGDALAVRVCEELLSTGGHRTALVWPHDPALAKQLERIGCDYLPFSPNDYESLRSVGVGDALSLMALAEDDRVNLQVALKARDINPQIRIVLRQFNRTLARKIEQNLPNCSVLSLESHAAATIVGAALDRSCFSSLQFPDLDGVLCGFAERSADEFGIVGMTFAAAQAHLKMRVLAYDGIADIEPMRTFEGPERVVVFGELRYLIASSMDTVKAPHAPPWNPAHSARRLWRTLRHADPVLRTVIAAAIVVFVCATISFSFMLHKDPVTAAYFVLTTMSTTGYGDITPLDAGHVPQIVAMIVMVAGVGFSGLGVAFATTALTRAQWTALQGLRRIRSRGHVIVCGAGNVGTRVIDFLRMLDQHVVVIDPSPDAEIVEMSRTREIQLLTGDATRDGTLELCRLPASRCVIAVTSSDTINLEVALGARGRNNALQVVMRVQEEAFAGSIGRQFEDITTFSTSELAAPAFAGLSRFPGTRGRIEFGDEDYTVGERLQGEIPAPPPANHCIALGVWRDGAFVHIDRFDQMQPFDRLLFIVPLSQFRGGAPRRQRRTVPFANTG